MGYAARDACRLSGCAYKTLDYWCKTGILRPSIREADGKGSDRVFSAIDVRCLMLLTALRRQVTLPVAVQFADYLRQHPDLDAADLLVMRDGTVEARRWWTIVSSVMRGGVHILAAVPVLEGGPA